MKIAVYSIMKNESKHIDRFMDGCEGADCVVVLDTGSTDDSVLRLKKRGASVYQEQIEPWRFDTARNRSLELVPTDIDFCICIDLDEILLPGWRAEMERCPSWTTRIIYWHRNMNDADDKNAEYYPHHKAHSRHGFRWSGAIHEELRHIGPNHDFEFYSNLKVDHIQDRGKKREYLPLLLTALKECPDDGRLYHYVVLEYMYVDDYENMWKYAKEALNNSRVKIWDMQAAYLCSLVASVAERKEYYDDAQTWLIEGVLQCPRDREPWFRLAKWHYEHKEFVKASRFANSALELDKRQLLNISELDAWNGTLDLIAASSAAECGNRKEADVHYLRAMRRYPNNDDLIHSYANFLSKK